MTAIMIIKPAVLFIQAKKIGLFDKFLLAKPYFQPRFGLCVGRDTYKPWQRTQKNKWLENFYFSNNLADMEEMPFLV